MELERLEQPEQKENVLGIEMGSTNIKAVLLNKEHVLLAEGEYAWESTWENGIWTYRENEIVAGIQGCYAALAACYRKRYGEDLTTVGMIGLSGMMHGYLALDASWRLLVPFRTWRNTITEEAAGQLSRRLHFHIPQRWSVAHLARAMLRREEHLERLVHLTTLSGYLHHRMTGENVLGVGDASGMFPVDAGTGTYDAAMVSAFDTWSREQGYTLHLTDLLPTVRAAGEPAGVLTAEGARLLDPSGCLRPGIPFCPPEGDAGTGMTATNAVRVYTGNVSAGTSAFAMVVVDHPPSVRREIDMVATPDGQPVAMVHCNTCTPDINAWAGLFADFAAHLGVSCSREKLYTLLFQSSLEGKADCGGLLAYNYIAGEEMTAVNAGCPVFLRPPYADLTLGNFMKTHLFSALATLKIGLDLLTEQEHLRIDRLTGHGGFFRVPEIGQRLLSAAAGVPVSVMESAGKGGPYGMALLASYAYRRNEGESLADYLEKRVFGAVQTDTCMADPEEIEDFRRFLERYIRAFDVERMAAQIFS